MKPMGIVAALKYGWYGCTYILRYRFGATAAPLIRGLVLTNRCNLRCHHCRVAERGPMDLEFAEAVSAIDAFYHEGGRCLYLEGGEPFLWRDGSQDLEDVVAYAHRRGYFTVVVYTNGTRPLQTDADLVFVSVDGLRDTHDSLRGKSFDRIMDNIRASAHPSLYINCTINNRNKDEIPAFCAYIHRLGCVRGTFFYFHTPYYGYDELHVAPSEKRRVLEELLELRRDYRILNSPAGLRAAWRNNWRRPMRICSVYEKGTVYECCRFKGNPGLCRDCGYLSYPEIDQALKWKPSALAGALRYF
jgi:MoaA/NifB/PqqE/SkfB family radical SAM enzyme